MMWDFSGNNSGYPQPPTMQMPSPSMPMPQRAGATAGAPTFPGGSSYPSMPSFSPSYRGATPQPYPQHATRRSVTAQPPRAAPVVYVQHASHHKHRHHRSRSHSHSHTRPPPMPVPIAHAFSHQPQATQYNYSYSYQHPPPQPVPPHQHHHKHNTSSKKPPATYPVPNDSPHFQYSKCTGRRKALCIGINYLRQPNELRGCINDAKHVQEFLIQHQGYKAQDIVLLTDDSRHARQLPTRNNIIEAMHWLVKDARTNDSLFFHYSGHGGQTKDLDGDEVDGWDEVIFPVDFKTAGHIVDDLMHDILVRTLPPGCRLTALFDACHSGTVLDLPYIYSSHGRLKGNQVSSKWIRDKSTPADVISWSGCLDGQTSADTFQGGVPVGAMSHAFITAITTKPKQSYQDLLRSIRLILHPRYSQKPQLGSSHHIDTGLPFVM